MTTPEEQKPKIWCIFMVCCTK